MSMKHLVLFLLSLVVTIVRADGILPPEFLPYNTVKSVRLPFAARQANTVFQDNEGIIWVGTNQGLVRYDGYTPVSYLARTSLTKGSVMSMIQVDDRHLLVAMHAGLVYFNLADGTEEDVPAPLSGIRSVRSLFLNGGQLWIGSDKDGLYLYDVSKKTLRRCKSQGRMTGVYSFCKVGGRLFVSSYEGVFYTDLKKGNAFLTKVRGINGFANTLLWNEKAKELYIGMEGELYTYQPQTGATGTIKALHGCVCKSLAFDKCDNLLIGTDAGLYIYNLATQKRTVLNQSISRGAVDSDIVWDVMTDRSGNVWLATQNGFAVMSRAEGLQYYDLREVLKNGSPNTFTSILLDSHKRLWLGGENGITLIDTRKGWQLSRSFSISTTASPLRHNRIRCIYEDRDGNVWIASDGSIARYNDGSGRFDYVTLINRLGEKGDWAYALYEDGQSRMWIATYSAGLFVIDKKKLVSHLGGVFHDTGQPSWAERLRVNLGVLRFDAGIGDELWLTGNGFSIRMNTRTCQRQFFKVDHSGRLVFCNGTVWAMGSNGRLMRYDRSKSLFTDLSIVIPGGSVQKSVSQGSKIWMSRADGLMALDTKTMRVSYYGHPEYLMVSGLYDPEGNRIIWGGENVITVCGTELKDKRHRAFITRVFYSENDKELLMPKTEKEIELPRSRNALLSFSTLDYSSSEDAVFFYQMGDKSEWQQLKPGSNELDLVRPASGTYQLKVSTTNPVIDKEVVITSYTLHVPYPWYMQGWAYAIYILLLAFIVALIVVRQRQAMHRKMVAQEREHVLESLKKRNEFLENAVNQPKLVEETTPKEEKPIKHLDEADARFMKQVDAIIEKKIDDDSFGVSVLADEMGLPQKQLYRKVKQITDITPVAYIRSFRMKQAAELLRDGRYTVTEVMYMVGFNNVSYFTKCFNTEYGVTPKQFMEQ